MLKKAYRAASPVFSLSPDYIRNSILRLAGDDEMLTGKKPMSIAVDQQVEMNPENSGTWITLSNNFRVWRLEVYSKEAEALAVFFNQYRLTGGSMLFLYDPDFNRILGGFNHLNNKKSGILQTAFIPGERIILELQVPPGEDYGDLSIAGFSHAFVDIFGKKSPDDRYFGTAGSCEVDINCKEGLAWQTIKRSVCRIIFKRDAFSSEICTGTLINNTAEDQKAFLYTANHCISNDFEAETAVLYFGYESAGCNGEDGINTMTLSSTEILATSDSLDFSLLLLSENPPDAYQPYFSGWSRIPMPPLASVTIHHPKGDVKKISRDADPAVTDYQENSPPSWLFYGSVPDAFWRIVEWETGATEAGSSGAPLYNQVKMIVGNLTGGDANCMNPVNDYFSKFHMNWDYYPEPERQLKYWLDSLNTGVEYINGYDPYDIPDGLDIELFQIFQNPGTGIFTIYTDTFDLEQVRIRIFNVSGSIIANYNALSLPLVQLELSHLPNGIYFIEISLQGFSERKKIILLK